MSRSWPARAYAWRLHGDLAGKHGDMAAAAAAAAVLLPFAAATLVC